MESRIEVLRGLLHLHWPDLGLEALERLLAFYALFVEENERQNLSKHVAPEDFWWGHLHDLRELMASGWILPGSAADLGSGGGIPGLAAACVSPAPWILIESEGRKAEFLERAVQTLGLAHVKVVNGRAERVIPKSSIGTIASRAVGKVSKIYGWIGKCSTWNNLVLFKGPGWEAEWEEFRTSPVGNRLRVREVRRYPGGRDGDKARLLVDLYPVRG